ncbi:MAG: ABC transporter ATP-binding protein [Nitrospiraceae bacterium]|nr:ABC transporter ATP-binding protein [Nitrospiraceae bacterium]
MAAEISIDISKTYAGRARIRACIAYPVEASTVLILFGPSGSGKSTILRSVAGLEWPEEGHIRFISRTWLDVRSNIKLSPQDRHVGYMGQDYALFPHYTVAGNIAYGLSEMPAADKQARVEEMVRLFRLQGLERAKPRELSGGQQQRVALARAVAPRPQLLLLDEPLSALDGPTRLQLRGELRGLLRQLALPSIIVTHDWAEALTLGDRIAVIADGNVVQTGLPQEVFSRPANAEVARVVGVDTVVQGRIRHSAEGLTTVEVGSVSLRAVGTAEEGPDVFVCIRAEDVTVERAASGETSARNHLPGTVHQIDSLGALARITLDCGFPLTAVITRTALSELGLSVGSSVRAVFKAGSVHLITRQ